MQGLSISMNIWGYSEDSELTAANLTTLQRLQSLLIKMEISALREDLAYLRLGIKPRHRASAL